MSTQNTAPLPLVSSEVEERITRALEIVYLSMQFHGAPMVDFAKADRSQIERALVRSLDALKALSAHRAEETVKAFRAGVREAIEPMIETARSDKAAYDALPASLKARLGAFATHILVPLSDVSGVFPEGTAVEGQVKLLHTMGYKVSKSTTGAYSLKVELPASITGVTPGSK